jgi:hypothetical protein
MDVDVFSSPWSQLVLSLVDASSGATMGIATIAPSMLLTTNVCYQGRVPR